MWKDSLYKQKVLDVHKAWFFEDDSGDIIKKNIYENYYILWMRISSQQNKT